MLPALIVIFREGFESFLCVAIIFAFLRKTGRDWLRPAVYAGIAVALAASVALGFLLMEVQDPLYEGILGLVAVVLVCSFVIHVWRTAPHMKGDIETRLDVHSSRSSRFLAAAAVFGFTVLMITREGMEAALMLIQVRENPQFLLGAAAGLALAALLSWGWARYGHRIDVRRFFQITGMFLLLFAVQIAVYSIHEFSEAGVLPNSDSIHHATEPFSPVGYYGRWFSVALVVLCGAWLAIVTWIDRAKSRLAAA